MKKLVIIPTYNERENIELLIEKVLSKDPELEILVIDDHSPDQTSVLVERLMANNQRIKLIQRAGKLGLGTAYVEGFQYAIKNDYEYIIQMDADFSHNPKVIPFFLREIENYDCIIGSRYLSGINVINWSFSRLLISYLAAQYVQLITGMPIQDPTGGFKCIRVSALRKIDLKKILSDGYSFQIEINYRLWCNKLRIKEIPIVFTERRAGESKISRKIVKEAFFMVWKLKILSFLGEI